MRKRQQKDENDLLLPSMNSPFNNKGGPRRKWSKRDEKDAVARIFCMVVCVVILLIARPWQSSKPWYHEDNYINSNCQELTPIQPPDLTKLSTVRQERFQKIRKAVSHAWKGYSDVALRSIQNGGVIPPDDLEPISRSAMSWLNYGATLHDSIDTLYLANLTEEYNHAVELITNYDIQTMSLQATKTFEYSLRVVGGLLGAYSVSGDSRLLAVAQHAADAILDGPFDASPTLIPRPFNVLAPRANWWDWKAQIQRLYKTFYTLGRNYLTTEHQWNSLSGIGSFGLEFSFLSQISGDNKYRTLSDAIFRHVKKHEDKGVVPIGWSVLTGEPERGSAGSLLGSGSDSFFEYLIKVPLLDRCHYDRGMEMYSDRCTVNDKDHLEMYQKMVKESLHPAYTKKWHVGGQDGEQLKIPYEYGSRYDHLLCFLPGMLALGAHTQDGHSKEQDMTLARDLLKGCGEVYKLSPSGLSADTGYMKNGDFKAADSSYYLRPEFIESLFVMYRITKDESLQDLAWQIFESLESHCKVEEGGYAGLHDVNNPSAGHVDNMPSYFLAETLKYLLLLFGPDDYVSLDDFVFTTEAHPLRILQPKSDEQDEKITPYCVLSSRPPVTIPWTLLCLLSLITVVSCCWICLTWKTLQLFIDMSADKRKTH
jgi:mannosyl-oligosaccharide alpha-1,2-mannosidase